MPTLRQRLNELATSFAANVLAAIRGSSLEDILAESSGGGGGASKRVQRSALAVKAAPKAAARPAAPAPGSIGRRTGLARLKRRTPADIGKVVERIVSLLRQHPKGLRAEQIRQKLHLQAKELPRPIADGLKTKRFGKTGQKRATTYSVKSAAAPKAKPKSKAKAKKKAAATPAPAVASS